MQFADKMEHIPIKKRRFWCRSPSPSPSPPPRTSSLDREESLSSQPQNPPVHIGEYDQLANNKCASSQQSSSNPKTGVLDGSARVESSAAAIPVIETMASLEEERFVQKDLVNVDKTDGLLVQDNFIVSLHNPHNDETGGPVGGSLPSKSERLHWDLNIPMDQWEEPIFDSQINTSASMLVQGREDTSRTPNTIHGNSSPQSIWAEKIDVVSTDKPNLDKLIFNTNSIKTHNGEDSGGTSGKDPSSDYNSSVVSQDNLGHMTELQEGYDSPMEEGELREPISYSWGDNEDEGNGSFDRDYIDALDKNTEHKRSCGKAVLEVGPDKVVEHCEWNNNWMKSSRAASLKKAYGGNQFLKHLRDASAEGNREELEDKNLVARQFRARESRQKFSPSMEGPFLDLKHRKNSFFKERKRHDKSHGRGSFSFPAHRKNEADLRWVDDSVDYQNSRGCRPHSYRGPEGYGYSRPRGDDRQSENYSSNGRHRHFISRRAPSERDDSFGSHRGRPPRSWSPDMTEKYSHRFRRGSKEERHEGVPDNAGGSFNRTPHYLGRRDRDARFSRTRRESHSRSRSRSPVAWRVQRNPTSPPRMFERSQSQRCELGEDHAPRNGPCT